VLTGQWHFSLLRETDWIFNNFFYRTRPAFQRDRPEALSVECARL